MGDSKLDVVRQASALYSTDLLGLEALSLLIGSVLLFLTFAGVMFATRRIDWSGGEAGVVA